MKLLLLVLLTLLLSGCETKTVYVKQPCEIITLMGEVKTRTYGIVDEDIPLHKAYINEFRTKMKKQDEKVEKSNEICRDWREK